MVAQESHRDPYCAFFTSDEALSDYMVSLLRLHEGDLLFEPAAGEGHLIDSVKRTGISCPITAYELHPKQIAALKRKFGSDETVTLVEQDTILCPNLDLRENFGPRFNKILANPPYGAWQEYERRADLKKRFRGFYVRETYTLFLLRCLRLLEHGGTLVFLIPNTFLYLHRHAPLRKYILENFSIATIDVFKPSLFPGVSFGYADLCILSILAHPAEPDHSLRLRFVDTSSDFNSPSHIKEKANFLLQKNLLRDACYTIPVSVVPIAREEPTKHHSLLGEVAVCKTGFYSGDDRRFLRRASTSTKRAKDYDLVDSERVEPDVGCLEQPLEGLDSTRCFLPILKGGGFHFLKPTTWYVDWSREAVAHYKTDKKARFQNSPYYFKRGIGFPMVTSTRPTASLIQGCLFDQSIVGIFPTKIDFEFLLAYCNSQPFWACLKALNPSANNSAKYVSRTPILRADPAQEAEISLRTKELLQLLQHGDPLAKTLEREILDAITLYVKRISPNTVLEPAARHAVAQL